MSLQNIKKNRTQDTTLGKPLRFMAEATTYGKYHVKVGVHFVRHLGICNQICVKLYKTDVCCHYEQFREKKRSL